MEFVNSHSNGVDELFCPICGRRILIQWPPDYKKIVLEVGDDYAIHSGGKGGLVVGDPRVITQNEESKQDTARLDQWEQWLSEMGFDDRWSGDS
jgi:hypothetical protein